MENTEKKQTKAQLAKKIDKLYGKYNDALNALNEAKRNHISLLSEEIKQTFPKVKEWRIYNEGDDEGGVNICCYLIYDGGSIVINEDIRSEMQYYIDPVETGLTKKQIKLLTDNLEKIAKHVMDCMSLNEYNHLLGLSCIPVKIGY
jgi:hypothetical protein